MGYRGKRFRNAWLMVPTGAILSAFLLGAAPLGAQTSSDKGRHRNAAGIAANAIVLRPASASAGKTLPIEALGLKYRPGLMLGFEPAGLTVFEIKPAELGVRFRLTIAPGARPGPYALVIRGADQLPQRVPAAFTVTPAAPGQGEARVLRVRPAKVAAGNTYTLELSGENFSSSMSVSFGKDIQALTPAIVRNAEQASLRVAVSPSAVPGARLARVGTPGRRSVQGPGGVVVTGFPSKSPAEARGRPATIPVSVVPPHGKIMLIKPNVEGSGEFTQVKMWDDPPMIQKDTVFTWLEDNPGIAKYFVFSIKDKDGKTIVQAQSPGSKPFYRVTTAMLKSLPDGAKAPFFHWELPPPPPGRLNPAHGPSVQASSTRTRTGTSSLIRSGVSQTPLPTQQQVQAVVDTMSASSGFADYSMVAGMIGMTATDKAQATWQVKGYWENPVTKEVQEVESSPAYPLRLPDVPKGMLVCGNAAQPGVLRVENMSQSQTAVFTAPVVVSLQGDIDLSRDPYPVSVTFSSLQTMTLEYSNVYLSWGDGTVEPLRVDGAADSNGGKVKLVLNGSATNQGIVHTFAEPGNYTIKIYSLPTPDQQDPVGPALAAGGGGLYGAALHFMAGTHSPGAENTSSSGTVTAASAVHFSAPGSTSQQTPASTVSSHSPAATTNLAALGSDAYLIACQELHVGEPPDLTAEGPIHLLKVQITRFPGYEGIPAKVSDCAEAFTAEASLSYYGSKGHILWVWTVEGEPIMGSVADLPPAGESSPGTYTLTSPPLPVPLTNKPHSVCVRVKAFTEMGEIADIMTSNGGMSCSGASQEGQGQSGTTTVTKTVMRPSNLGFTELGSVVRQGPSGTDRKYPQNTGASTSSPQFLSNLKTNLSSSLPLMVKVQLQQNDRDVWSAPASYEVVPHDPNVPCRLFFQAKGGPFVISDIMGLAEEADETFSGKGMLHLASPSGPDGHVDFFVPITFSHLTLEGAGDGREVTAGTIDEAPYDAAILSGAVTGLTGRVTHVKATAGTGNDFLVTFQLAVSDMARLDPVGGTLGLTVTGPITADGDFYAEKTEPGGGAIHLSASYIGNSGFEVEGNEMVLDWSRTQGESPPGGSCYGQSGDGPGWVGLYFRKGTLKLNALGNSSLGAPLSAEGWSIGWGGLSGTIQTTPLAQGGTLSSGGLELQVKDISVDVCGSSLNARYGVSLKNVPLIEADVPGALQMDMQGNLASDFTSPNVTRDFGTVVMELKGADFNNEAGQGFRVALDALFTFKSKGRTLTQVSIDGIRVKGSGQPFCGEAFWKDGTQGATIPLGGTAQLGPITVDLVRLDLHLGSHHDKPSVDFGLDANFRISDVLAPSSNTLLYKLQSNSPMACAEPTMDSFSLEAAYPPVNPVATLKAKVTWSEDAQGNTRFLGHGTLSLLNTGDLGADFLLGYKGGKDYWLCRVSVGLGQQGVPLFPPFLNLYEVHGGLGHNIPLTSFASMGDLGSLTPTMDGSYIFNAGARVGDTGGGWIYTFQGDISVKATGPDAGFRLDVKAWLFTSDHSGNGQFQGFIQYAASSFDAGLSGEFHALGDAVWVKAPNGAISIHFGGGSWHIYMGQNVDGLRLSAHVLVADASGYLMLDDNGLAVGGVVGSSYHYGGSFFGFGAHVDFQYWIGLGVAISPDPTWGIHLHGEFDAGVAISAGLDTPVGCLCVNPSVGIHFTADAMPVHVCGTAYVRFGKICWCLVGCCKTYGVNLSVCL